MKRICSVAFTFAMAMCLMLLTACGTETVANAVTNASGSEEFVQVDGDDPITELEGSPVEVVEEEPEQADPSYPYANLDANQIESVVLNYAGCDPWELPENELEGFLAALAQLHIEPKPIEDLDTSGYVGQVDSKEDRFEITLNDGTSFIVTPDAMYEEYGFVIYIDRQPYSAEEETALPLYRFYHDHAETVRELNGLNDRIPQFDIEDAPQSMEELEDMFSDFISSMRGGN